MSYEDSSNTPELIRQFKNLIRDGDPIPVQEFLEAEYPGWLRTVTNDYSDDYEFLRSNWKYICTKNHTSPQRIITVSAVFFDKKNGPLRHLGIMSICEELTRQGYVIRRYDEFVNCPVCTRSIPAREVWESMRDKRLPVPEKWSPHCTKCAMSLT